MRSEAKLVRLYPWLIFIAGVVVFSLGVPHEYQTVYNARFGLFVKTAWHQGLTSFGMEWGRPYPDYTAATTLVSYLSSLLFGKVSVFAVSFPNVIVAALTLMFTYLIGAVHSRKWGLYGVVFVLLTIEFFVFSYSLLGPDQYIALITTISFYLVYSAKLLQHNKRLYLIPLMLVLGFIFRGPIGFVIPAGVVWVFYLCNRNYKALLLFSVVALALFAMCLMLLIAAAYHTGGMGFVNNVLFIQITHRLNPHLVQTGRYHSVFTYTQHVLLRYAITSLLAIMAIYLLIKVGHFRKILPFVAWALVVFVGIALVPGREARYVLSMAPPLALITAYLFVVKTNNKWICGLQKLKFWHVLIILLLYVVIILAIITPIVRSKNMATQFMQQVEAYNLPIGFYQIAPDREAIMLAGNSKTYFVPKFLNTPQQLIAALPRKMIVIAIANKLPVALHNKIKIVASGVIMQKKFIAFTILKD